VILAVQLHLYVQCFEQIASILVRERLHVVGDGAEPRLNRRQLVLRCLPTGLSREESIAFRLQLLLALAERLEFIEKRCCGVRVVDHGDGPPEVRLLAHDLTQDALDGRKVALGRIVLA